MVALSEFDQEIIDKCVDKAELLRMARKWIREWFRDKKLPSDVLPQILRIEYSRTTLVKFKAEKLARQLEFGDVNIPEYSFITQLTNHLYEGIASEIESAKVA